MKPIWKNQNLQCLEWPLEAERETIHRKADVKMPNFTAEINMLLVKKKNKKNNLLLSEANVSQSFYNSLIYIILRLKLNIIRGVAPLGELAVCLASTEQKLTPVTQLFFSCISGIDAF